MHEGTVVDTTAAAEVPAQRPPSGPDSASVLRGLGLQALVDVLEDSAYGVCITGDEHRWVYLNPAGCRMLGRPFEELAGTDYLLSFPPHERDALLALEHDQRQGDTAFYANTVLRPGGEELGIVWSGSVLHVDGSELAPAFFHPTQALRTPSGEAAALGAAAALMAAGGSVDQLLAALAEQAVAGSRATGCVVLVDDETGHLQAVAHCCLPDDVAARVAEARIRLDDLAGGDLLVEGRLVLLSDGRARLARTSGSALLAATCDVDWDGSVSVPLQRGGDVVGCLLLLLPQTVTAPTESELTFWSALGAHASAALAEERLREQAAEHAAELERQRLGRDLHDSVASALFALHARAQVITRGLARGDHALVAAAAADMESLSKQALADLRATVTSMRQHGTSEPTDLAAALHDLAATTGSRHDLPVEVRCAPSVVPHLQAQHLLRIAGEALHNCVKHARATRAVVELTTTDRELVLTVQDDGCGYDPDAGERGHGRRTMRERARLCGGHLTVDTAPGAGTRVSVHVPLPG